MHSDGTKPCHEADELRREVGGVVAEATEPHYTGGCSRTSQGGGKSVMAALSEIMNMFN